jgi:hypothetical protein
MSLILDALNRSESERATPDSVPGLQSVHGSPTANVPLWKKWLWPGLLMALLAVALAFQWGDGAPVPPAAEPTIVAAPATAAPPPPAAASQDPATAPQSGTVTAPAPAPDVQPAVSPDVAALYQAKPGQARPGDNAEAQPGSVQDEPAPAPPAPTTSREVAPVLDIDELMKAAEVALVERGGSAAPVVEHEAPFISELRQSEKDQIPSIFYSAHSWGSDPSERRVVLNGQERRAGQQVKPGLRLVEILEDSIVLDFRGTEFRLRSLNSWVNL